MRGCRGEDGENRLNDFCISDELISASSLLQTFARGGSIFLFFERVCEELSSKEWILEYFLLAATAHQRQR